MDAQPPPLPPPRVPKPGLRAGPQPLSALPSQWQVRPPVMPETPRWRTVAMWLAVAPLGYQLMAGSALLLVNVEQFGQGVGNVLRAMFLLQKFPPLPVCGENSPYKVLQVWFVLGALAMGSGVASYALATLAGWHVRQRLADLVPLMLVWAVQWGGWMLLALGAGSLVSVYACTPPWAVH